MSQGKEKKGFWKALFRPKHPPSASANLSSKKKSGTITV